MTWHLIVAVLFVLAVTYAAVLTRPFTADALARTSCSAALLGLLIVGVETRLRTAEVTDLLGALIGGAIGLGLAKTIGAALFWADTERSARRLPAQLHPARASRTSGIVMGARKGEWLRAGAAGGALPRRRAARSAIAFSTPASSSTAASPTSARPASSTARSSFRSSC